MRMLSLNTDLHVEESQRIIPGVLSVEVSHSNFVHEDIPGLTKLRTPIRSAETPAQASHRPLPGNLAVNYGDVHGAQAKHPPRLASPPDSLEANVPRFLEEIGGSKRLATTLGLDSDQVSLLVVWSDMSVGEIERPQSLVSTGDGVSVSPTYLGVVSHHYLWARIVHKFPQIGSCGFFIMTVEYISW